MSARIRAGAFAGIAAAAVFAGVDCSLLVHGVGGFWLGAGQLLGTLGLYLFLGAVLGVIAGWAGHLLRRDRPPNAVSSFERMTFLFTFLSMTCFCWLYVYDYGLGQSQKGQWWHFLAAVPLSLAFAIGTWLFVRLLVFPYRRHKYATAMATVTLAVVVVVEVFAVRYTKPGVLGAVDGTRHPAASAANIVLLVMDTTRLDALSCYGNPRRTTPALDRLASEGLIYTRAYAPGSWTPPSHASMFTGLYPSQHGTFGNQIALQSSAPTLAGILSEAGYETFFLSYKGVLRRAYGWDSGFLHSVTVNVEDKASLAYERLVEKLIKKHTSPTPRTVDIALRWLESRRSTRPFFLFVNVSDPHTPYCPREPFFSECSRGIDRSQLDLATVNKLARSQAEFVFYNQGKIDRLDESELRYLRCLYDSEANYQDIHLGRFFEKLRTLATNRTTVVIVTADHGELLGEHGLMGHGKYLYDELIYVPLIVWGTDETGTIDRPVSLIDVFPTVLQLGSTNEGRTIAPDAVSLLEPINDRTLFAESWASDVYRKAVIGEHYKYVWESAGDSCLFDLARDPDELEDFSGAAPQVASKFHEKLALKFELYLDRADSTEVDERKLKILKSLGYVQ